MTNIFDLKKNYFIVTGAANGNGLEFIKGILENNGLVIAIDKKKLPNLNNKNIIFIKCDISDHQSLQKFILSLDKEILKNLKGLVNNAGITLPDKKYTYNEKKFVKTININLFSQLQLTLLVARILKKNNSKGSIINITSLGSKLGFESNISYQISKNLFAQITKSQAVDFGTNGIRVNCICPGYIKTNMTGMSFANKTRSDKITNRTILKRWGKSKDLVGGCIFLLSDASEYITGSEITIDGGLLVNGL